MKHLIIALAAAVAVTTAFARITVQQGFETDMVGFVSSDSQEDASTNVTYAAESMAKPSDSLAPYPFSGFGDGFLSLDTGDATLWRENTVVGNVYLDMVMQFNPCTAAPALGSEGTKIAVYLNSDSNLVVMAGTSASDRTPTNYVTTAQLEPGTWGRLTISATVVGGSLAFGIRLNGVALTDGTTSEFPCLTADTTVNEVGFSGTGALDNFVARTTDPYIQNPAATIADGNEGYASLEDALADVDANTVITLGADHAAAITDLASGTTYKIANTNDFAFGGFKGANEVAVTTSGPDADGVTTYSAVEGVASLSFFDGSTWGAENWYATFDAAYAVAAADSRYANLKVKVGGDFVPSNITVNVNFYNVTFVATTENPISIAMSNGTYNFYAENAYVFPENATLNLPCSHSTYGISGGTLNIPANVVLTIQTYDALKGITGLTGYGTIKNGFQNAYNLLYYYNVRLPVLLRNSAWMGTLELSGSSASSGSASDWYDIEINKFANANSKVRFNGFTTRLYSSGQGSVAIELVGDGLTVLGSDEYSGRTYTIDGTVSGSGALTLADDTGSIILSGNTSGFTGSVTASGASSAITFGNSTTGSGQRIVIGGGETAVVGAGATWTAANVDVRGNLTVNGTVAVDSKGIKSSNGNGVIRFNNSSTALTMTNFADDWTATYVVGWTPAGRFNPNEYGYAGSTVAFAAGSGYKAYFGPGSATQLTINPTIRLDSDFTIADGYSLKNDNALVTFTRLTGDHNFTTSYGTGTDPAYSDPVAKPETIKTKRYAITTLDNFSGRLVVKDSSVLTIGTVNVTNGTDISGCIVDAECVAAKTSDVGAYADGKIPGYPDLTVDGVASGKLVYTTKDAVSGLYRAVAKVGDDYYATWADAFDNGGDAGKVEKVADVNPSVVPAGWSVDGSGNYVKAYAITYTLTAESAVGAAPAAESYTVDTASPVTLTQPDAVTGYTFRGWYDNAELTGDPVTEFVVNTSAPADKAFYGKFTINTYTLTVEVGENMTVAVYTNGVEEAAGAAGDYALEYGNSASVEYTAAKDYKITTNTSTNIVGIVEDVVVAAATVEACVYYTAVTLNKATTSIETNLTETLEATFTPASAADDSYTWASSDTSKATVDQNGVVTAIAAGEVTITVTATHNPLVTASCKVTVTATSPTPPVTPIDPASGGEKTYDNAKDAADAADAINADKETNIPIPSAAATGMSTEQKAAYYGNVTAVAEGTTVKVEFTEAGTNAVQVIADNASTNAVFSSAVSAAAAAGASGSGSATVAAAPGLYYSVESTDDLGTPMTEGDRVLATGSTVTLTVPNKGAAGFYKVKVSPADKKSE